MEKDLLLLWCVEDVTLLLKLVVIRWRSDKNGQLHVDVHTWKNWCRYRWLWPTDLIRDISGIFHAINQLFSSVKLNSIII